MTEIARMSVAVFRPSAVGPELRREPDHIAQSSLDYVPAWHARADAAPTGRD